MRFPFVLVLLFAVTILASAQDDSTSVADAARMAHAAPAKSKTTITEENLAANRGPLPDMNIDGVDNSDDIIRAIAKFRQSHKPDEVEQVVHAWYDRYDMMFQKALDENSSLRTRKQDQAAHPPTLVYRDDEESYKRIDEIRRDQVLSDLQDQRKLQKKWLTDRTHSANSAESPHCYCRARTALRLDENSLRQRQRKLVEKYTKRLSPPNQPSQLTVFA